MEFLDQINKTIFNFQHHHKLLFLEALVEIVIVICLPTKHLRVLKNSLKLFCAFKIEVEFRSADF